MPVPKNATKIETKDEDEEDLKGKTANETKTESHKWKINETEIKFEEVSFKFDNVSESLRGPKVVDSKDIVENQHEEDLRNFVLPDDIQEKLNAVIESYVNGELTDRGLAQEQALLWQLYLEELKKEGKRPERKEESKVKDIDQVEVKGHEHQGKSGQQQGNILSSEKKSAKDNQGVLNVQESQKKVVDKEDTMRFQPKIQDKDGINLLKLHASQDLKAKDDGNGSFRGRQLKSVDETVRRMKREGFMPWERQGTYDQLMQKVEEFENRRDSYDGNDYKNRRLLDTFGDSLRHVNKLFNAEFGYKARKVPAHMPHFMDKNVLYELHDRFPNEWDETSSHRVRHSRDMQFAFSYFYFLMHEPAVKTVSDVFDEMDTDHSGILSDREVRTLATRLYEAPLDLQTLTGFENLLINCSKHLSSFYSRAGILQASETYYVKEMPQVTKWLINACTAVTDLIVEKFPAGYKYNHEVVAEDDVAFKMIKTNVSHVVAQLDDIRRHPKKFVCLNDNIDHSKAEQAKTVKAVLQDFYESLFPIPSGFELPREYRNRFLRLDELYEWRKYRDWLKWWTYLALGLLIIFTIASFFSDKIDALQKSFLGRRSTGDSFHTPGGLQVV